MYLLQAWFSLSDKGLAETDPLGDESVGRASTRTSQPMGDNWPPKTPVKTSCQGAVEALSEDSAMSDNEGYSLPGSSDRINMLAGWMAEEELVDWPQLRGDAFEVQVTIGTAARPTRRTSIQFNRSRAVSEAER
jgi:hypothetical protein